MSTVSETRQRIGIVGGGIAGIAAAYLLQQRYEVELIEKNDYLGGHTHTFIVPGGEDEGLPIDTGFIVLNNRTYPNLHRLFSEWNVAVRFSDMSFGFHCERTGLQYSGRGLSGLFAQRRNLMRPRYWRFLAEIRRFCGNALRDRGMLDDETRLGTYLEKNGFSADFIADYILPMGAAIWSAPAAQILEFPVATFVRFFYQHGLLSLRDRPRWQTVCGGSHTYVNRFRERFDGEIFLRSKIVSVTREPDKVTLQFEQGGNRSYDQVVMATHADQVLGLLSNPSREERELFSKWRYERNRVVLHYDHGVLPPNRRAWSSWNYCREHAGSENERISVTYHMNRLQGLSTARHYCVTLNRQGGINEERVLYQAEYDHPVYDREAVRTQALLGRINGAERLWYCGSYFGFGFHEDAATAGIQVARGLQISW